MESMFKQELVNVYQLIDTGALKQFLYTHASEIVGVTNGLRLTTLADEVAEVARLAHKAYVGDGINYYRSYMAYNNAECDVDARSAHLYQQAAKKLLWLNSLSRSYTGDAFLVKKIDKSSSEDCKNLVDAFEFCVRNYAEI